MTSNDPPPEATPNSIKLSSAKRDSNEQDSDDRDSDERDSDDPGTVTMQRLRGLDNPAWAKLVDHYFSRVYGWCRDAGLDAHTSADVAQDVFVSALQSLPRFKQTPSSTFGGWLRTICQRRIADHWRKQGETPVGGTDAMMMFSQLECIRKSLESEASDQESAGTSSPSVPPSAPSIGSSNEALAAALVQMQNEFEPTTWQAFWLTAVDGRSAADIAADLSITRNAVYVAKSRVLKRLRAVLDS